MVRELNKGHRVILKAVLLPRPIGNSDSHARPTDRWEENLSRCEGLGMETSRANEADLRPMLEEGYLQLGARTWDKRL